MRKMSLNALNLIICLILQSIIVQSVYSVSIYPKENGVYDLVKICGRTGRRPKIVGGDEAFPKEFPWLVNIKFKGQPHCGGSLISDQFIITAAHCLVSRSSELFTVRLGSLYLNSFTEEGVIEVPILKYHIHEYFNRPRLFSNDIALIKINPINFTDQISPICLPSNEIKNYENLVGKVAGFGWTKYPLAKLPNSLQKVELPITSNRECEEWFKENHHLLYISENQFCAGYAEGQRDACRGDSGNSFLVQGPTNRWQIIGIVSAGIGCADPKMPGVYTKVSAYLDWIANTVANKFSQ